MADPLVLEVCLVIVGGRYSPLSMGDLSLFVHLGATYYGETKLSSLTVLEGEEVRRSRPQEEEVRELWSLLKKAGLPDRAPRVVEVPDSSDSWARIGLTLHHMKGSHQVDFTVMCSGYEGEDAPAMMGFFRRLFDLAAVRDSHSLC